MEKIANVIPVPFGVDFRGPINFLSIDREASYFRRWWVRWPARKILSYLVKPAPRITDVDLIFVHAVYSRLDFSRFKAKTAYYATDPHYDHLLRRYIDRVKVQNYDYVFVTQKDYIDEFRRHNYKSVSWLPYACDPQYHKSYSGQPDYDVCFIGQVTGTYLRRKEMIDILASRYKTYVTSAYLHDLARAYIRAKIIFNRSVKGDLNQRVFEALACNRLLVTDRIGNGLQDLFSNRKHLVLYDSVDDLVDLIDYYLGNGEERESIAEEGQKEVYQKHTYLHRARTILEATQLM